MAREYALPTQTIAEAVGAQLTITVLPDGRPPEAEEAADDETATP